MIGRITTWAGRARRQHEAVVVGVGHDQPADRGAWRRPRRSSRRARCVSSVVWNSMLRAFEKFCPRKCDVPAWSALRSCIIASMQSVSTAPGKRSLRVFFALDHRHRHEALREVGVDVEHPLGLLHRLRRGRVRRVALLPEELGRAQEQPRAHLPAHDVGPLVDEQRQIAVALHPLRERIAR